MPFCLIKIAGNAKILDIAPYLHQLSALLQKIHFFDAVLDKLAQIRCRFDAHFSWEYEPKNIIPEFLFSFSVNFW